MPEQSTLRTVLENAWDDGNAAGLDGWVGPGRGIEPVDEDAILRRQRATKNALANLADWRPPARVIETAQELEALRCGSVALVDGSAVQRHEGGWWFWANDDSDEVQSEDLARFFNRANPAVVLWESKEADR